MRSAIRRSTTIATAAAATATTAAAAAAQAGWTATATVVSSAPCVARRGYAARPSRSSSSSSSAGRPPPPRPAHQQVAHTPPHRHTTTATTSTSAAASSSELAPPPHAGASFHTFVRRRGAAFLGESHSHESEGGGAAVAWQHRRPPPLVLGEWALSPADAAVQRRDRRRTSAPPRPPPQRGERDSAAGGGEHPHPHPHHHRRHDVIDLARRDVDARLARRHRSDESRRLLHAYRIVKGVEVGLVGWARARRRDGAAPHSTPAAPSSSSPSRATAGAADAATTAEARHDVDAVEATLYEYAGQLQRTLRQLTPRSFDAVRDYRQRTAPHQQQRRPSGVGERETSAHTSTSSSSTASLSSPPPPLLLLRLLWRLLRIQQLFFSIGRHASLPRTAVHVYVQSSHCHYGVREVLRVLGDELARSTSSTTTHDGVSVPPVLPLHNAELFQLFYAALSLSGEDAPGVPLHSRPAPTMATPPSWSSSSSPSPRPPQPQLPDTHYATCMPLEEWCVRWWVQQLSTNAAAAHLPLPTAQAMDVLRACMYATNSSNAAAHQQMLLTPFMYFESRPDGSSSSSSSSDTAGVHALHRRYRPQLRGVLGGDRSALRVPYLLSQQYVEGLLRALLTTASSTSSAADVATGVDRLLRRRDRDAVRDVALLCTAVLYFEVFSPSTAAFMAHAAPLCQAQMELLSGHEISCVLLAYASLQRWESAGVGQDSRERKSASHHHQHHPSHHHRDNPNVTVQSASTAATATRASPSTASPSRHEAKPAASTTARPAAASSSSSSAPSESWHLFYITLASRAGQLSDTLSEEDVTRVLRAMTLTGIEHADLRLALASSLRMRNVGRRVLFET